MRALFQGIPQLRISLFVFRVAPPGCSSLHQMQLQVAPQASSLCQVLHTLRSLQGRRQVHFHLQGRRQVFAEFPLMGVELYWSAAPGRVDSRKDWRMAWCRLLARPLAGMALLDKLSGSIGLVVRVSVGAAMPGLVQWCLKFLVQDTALVA